MIRDASAAKSVNISDSSLLLRIGTQLAVSGDGEAERDGTGIDAASLLIARFTSTMRSRIYANTQCVPNCSASFAR